MIGGIVSSGCLGAEGSAATGVAAERPISVENHFPSVPSLDSAVVAAGTEPFVAGLGDGVVSEKSRSNSASASVTLD